MKQKGIDNKILWRKVQVKKCISVLLICCGVLLTQLPAYLLCVLGYFLFYLSQGMLTEDLMIRISEEMTSGDSTLLITVSAVSALLCLLWCGILYRRSDWREKDFSYRKAFTLPRLLSIVGIGAGGCVVATIAVAVFFSFFPALQGSYDKLMSQLDVENSVLTMVYVIFLGPISEEVIFRGAIMDRLKIAFPFWVANVLQALLFGIYHWNLVQGMYAFVLGTILGLVGAVTGSILASILTHIIFNGTNMLLGILFQQIGMSAYSGMIMAMLLLAALAALIWGVGYYRREWRQCTQKAGLEG